MKVVDRISIQQNTNINYT